jgi:hypothetical protein
MLVRKPVDVLDHLSACGVLLFVPEHFHMTHLYNTMSFITISSST